MLSLDTAQRCAIEKVLRRSTARWSESIVDNQLSGLTSGFGCKSDAVVNLLVTIGFVDAAKRFYRTDKPLAVVVPIENTSGTNYPLNEPSIALGFGRANAFRISRGSIGNNLPNVATNYRPATEEEITTALVALTDGRPLPTELRELIETICALV